MAAVRPMLPWFFAYDRINNARYPTTYWFEMLNLPDSRLSVQEQFEAGEFVVQQQQQDHSFAQTAMDQTIEQTGRKSWREQGARASKITTWRSLQCPKKGTTVDSTRPIVSARTTAGGLLGGSGRVINSLDFCPASLKSLGCFYFRCVLSSQTEGGDSEFANFTLPTLKAFWRPVAVRMCLATCCSCYRMPPNAFFSRTPDLLVSHKTTQTLFSHPPSPFSGNFCNCNSRGICIASQF